MKFIMCCSLVSDFFQCTELEITTISNLTLYALVTLNIRNVSI